MPEVVLGEDGRILVEIPLLVRHSGASQRCFDQGVLTKGRTGENTVSYCICYGIPWVCFSCQIYTGFHQWMLIKGAFGSPFASVQCLTGPNPGALMATFGLLVGPPC